MDTYKLELIWAYVPEAECMTLADAYELAVERDEEAARILKESVNENN